jgi:hypothetical protein
VKIRAAQLHDHAQSASPSIIVRDHNIHTGCKVSPGVELIGDDDSGAGIAV